MLSEKPWKLDAVIRLLLGILIGLAAIVLLATMVRQVTGAQPDDNSPLSLVLGTLSLDGSVLVAVVIFLRLEHLGWAEAFGLKTPPLGRAVLWGLVVAVCFLPVGLLLRVSSDLLLQLIHVPATEQQAVETLKNAPPGIIRVYLVFFAVVLAPVAEETLFRGILYPTIKQCGFPRVALWGTSLLFALIHLDVPTFVPLLVLALALAVLYEKTNNLLACITAHSVFNAANVTLLWLSNPGNRPPH